MIKKNETEKLQYEHVTHTFGPVYDHDSKILILGSMPSVKSREQNFYYGHPQNRFWKVMAAVTSESVPDTIEEKRSFLLRNRVALWDVIESCDIIGSSDSSIRNVKENDMRVILNAADIQAIFANGGKAYELFMRYCSSYLTGDKKTKLIRLPSTSPANAAWSLDRLTGTWENELSAYLTTGRIK